jgi:hypothetical protein
MVLSRPSPDDCRMGITWGALLWASVLLSALVVAAALAKRLGDDLVGAVGRRGLFLLPVLFVWSVAYHLGERFGGTSPKKVRKLAASTAAVRGREQAEATIRRIIAAWDERTPLTLGMIAINDRCIGGEPPEWFFSSGDSRYKVRCALYVTAYFGADPSRIADTIDGILTAGDEHPRQIPHDHEFFHANRVVDYYRGTGGEPSGAGTGETNHFSSPGLTLHWDRVRTAPGLFDRVEEPEHFGEHDPPVCRRLREPASATVTELRRQHGMVFALRFSELNYFTEWK